MSLALAAHSGEASTAEPLGVHMASLTQRGQQLVWHLQLDQPFSPSALQPNGRSLCLLIERAANGTVAGQVCIIGPPPGQRKPRIVYMRVTRQGPGPGRAIAAEVTRSSQQELTARFLPASVGIGYRPLRWQVISTLSSPPCAPAAPQQSRCYVVFPAVPRLLALHTPRIAGCAPSGASLIFSGRSDRHAVALTFDDGPWPDTAAFLNVLERKHVHATFFQIGEQVATYGRSVDRRMLADGDIIGDHTWSHPNVAGDGSFAAAQIAGTAQAIRRVTGFEPCLFRPPYGASSSALVSEARAMRFLTIMWDVDTVDWSRPGTDVIYDRAVSGAHNGAIILQHDGGGDRSETLDALPREIDTLRRAHYRFLTIPELLGLRVIYR